MKTRILLSILALASVIGAFGQNSYELSFTAVDESQYVQLDSIKIMNRTQGGDTVLYWPDTVLVIYWVGLSESPELKSKFQVFPNYPNPVSDRTTISIYVPDRDIVNLSVTDMLGRVILKSDKVLDRGIQSFHFTPGDGKLYYFTARWRGHSHSIKILQSGSNSTRGCSIDYMGNENAFSKMKATEKFRDFFFTPEDKLLYIGYANGLQSGILDDPEESQTYTFQFATNIPCPGMPTVNYQGQIYNTIQIYGQCWLKENLNVGTMIMGGDSMNDNGIIEKYCYANQPDSCNIYGGLYQWKEIMQYTNEEGTRGICPPGWHLPTHKEWMVLEGATDSQYGIGDSVWDSDIPYRGFDAGANLKTTSGWTDNGNGTDLFGFSAMPCGMRYRDDIFSRHGQGGYWWTSTDAGCSHSTLRIFWYENSKVGNSRAKDWLGYSVRCVRDN